MALPSSIEFLFLFFFVDRSPPTTRTRRLRTEPRRRFEHLQCSILPRVNKTLSRFKWTRCSLERTFRENSKLQSWPFQLQSSRNRQSRCKGRAGGGGGGGKGKGARSKTFFPRLSRVGEFFTSPQRHEGTGNFVLPRAINSIFEKLRGALIFLARNEKSSEPD